MASCKCICFLCTIIVLAGVSVLIAWLADNPKRPIYSMEGGSISNFNLTRNNHFSATFNFLITSSNRNSRFNYFYDDVMLVAVYHKNFLLAYQILGPFKQVPKNETRIMTKLVATDVALGVSNSTLAVAEDLRTQSSKNDAVMGLKVQVRATMRYKIRSWKRFRDKLKVACLPPALGLALTNTSTTFQKIRCSVSTF